MKFLLKRSSVRDYQYENKSNDEILDLIKVDRTKYKLCVKKCEYVLVNKMHYTKKGVFIEINNIDELLELEKDYGEIIITSSTLNKDIKVIEIYDDYRE